MFRFLESHKIFRGVIPSFEPNAMIWMDQVDAEKIRVNQIGKVHGKSACFLNMLLKQFLVGGWNHFERYACQIKIVFKIKTTTYIDIYFWNHYLLFGWYIGISQLCGYQAPVMVKVGNLKVPKKTREANRLENTGGQIDSNNIQLSHGQKRPGVPDTFHSILIV